VNKKQYYVYQGKKYSVNLKKLALLVSPLKKLQSMIGLDKLKKSMVDMVLYFLQNFDGNNNMLHSVIAGPPGVGKTEVGLILAEIYASLGVTKNNKFRKVKRTDLIGQYLGQTAKITQDVIDEVDGGVLFIDEAYSLGNPEKRDSYSKECIDTINQNLSENKKSFICIIAGYEEELDSNFFSVNPGLKRRFPFKFKIDGYNNKEMAQIYLKNLTKECWSIDDPNVNVLEKLFQDNKEQFTYFGGDIENFFLICKFVHSKRVFGKNLANKKVLTLDDISVALKQFIENKKKAEQTSHHMMYL
jgi:SpoVK/Ycf46/Vps4 family AAA+-type ATPase